MIGSDGKVVVGVYGDRNCDGCRLLRICWR
jgi:hypothetical protein